MSIKIQYANGDGTYTYLSPEYSVNATNANKLGGIESGLYATKEYVDNKIELKKEIIEDTTYTYTTWQDDGPYVMNSKDLSSTIALKFTVIVNGTLGGDRGHALGFQIWPTVNKYITSDRYTQPLFMLAGSATTPVNFSNSTFNYFTTIGECGNVSIIDGTESTGRILYGQGWGRQSSAPGAMYISTDKNLLSTGYRMGSCDQSLNRINLTVRYIVTKYYFG